LQPCSSSGQHPGKSDVRAWAGACVWRTVVPFVVVVLAVVVLLGDSPGAVAAGAVLGELECEDVCECLFLTPNPTPSPTPTMSSAITIPPRMSFLLDACNVQWVWCACRVRRARACVKRHTADEAGAGAAAFDTLASIVAQPWRCRCLREQGSEACLGGCSTV
jgi:hypothetical protein